MYAERTMGIWNSYKSDGISGAYLGTGERNHSIIRSPSPSCFPFPPDSPFYWLFARFDVMETFLSRRTHYHYLRPADHHHQLIPYRRRSSTAVPFFFLLKKRPRHSSLSQFPALLRLVIVRDRNRE